MAEGGAGQGLAATLQELRDEIRATDRVSVQAVLRAFRGRVFGPVLALIGMIVLTPLGGVPGVPTLMAMLLFLIAVQRLIGLTHPWIPRQLRERSVDQDKLCRALERCEPWARRIDKGLRPRMTWMLDDFMAYVLAAILVAVALMIPPLELVPFAAAVPGAATLLFGLALTARDGLVALLGVFTAAATAAVLVIGLL